MRLAQHVERFLAVLVAHGRTVSEGYDAYALLMASVTGAAAMAIGRAAADAAGHGTLVDLRHAAAALGDDETPLVHKLTRRRRREPDPFAAVRPRSTPSRGMTGPMRSTTAAPTRWSTDIGHQLPRRRFSAALAR